MRLNFTIIIALASILNIVLANGAAAPVGVWYVDQRAVGANNGTSWHDAFVDLQDALAVVEFPDEVWVATGVYKPDRGTGDRMARFHLVDGRMRRMRRMRANAGQPPFFVDRVDRDGVAGYGLLHASGGAGCGGGCAVSCYSAG